jgi:hypothetical protein
MMGEGEDGDGESRGVMRVFPRLKLPELGKEVSEVKGWGHFPDGYTTGCWLSSA